MLSLFIVYLQLNFTRPNSQSRGIFVTATENDPVFEL